MAIHINEVGNEAKTIFSDVRTIGKRVMDRFYEGFGLALKDVHKGWKHLKPRERKIVFEKVQDVAKELIVDKADGGGVQDGLALGTFYGYVCKVKRALIYNVPLHIAERATNQELQRAERYVLEVLKEQAGTIQEKMVKAYEWVKDQQIKLKEQLKADAAAGGNKDAANIHTMFTLPDPEDYEPDDESSDALLQAGISGFMAWLQAKSMQPHLSKDMKSAKVLRGVLGELTTYENAKAAKAAKAAKLAAKVPVAV